jgi:hypothetical protein
MVCKVMCGTRININYKYILIIGGVLIYGHSTNTWVVMVDFDRHVVNS